ncbi:MAG: ankyrin repeat domain-containing protein [Pseudorhodoplanes sp.]
MIRAKAFAIERAALCAALFLFVCGDVTNARAEGGPAKALLEAAANGDAAAVGRSLAAGVKADIRDVSGRTPLLPATHGNHIEAARLLIAAGADVNGKNGIQDSPYLYAGAHGRTEILKMTLAAGADLKSLNRYGGTALIPACHYGHVDAVKVLLATEIDIDHVNNLGWTALLEAVILGDGGPVHTEIVRLLLEAGANPAIADRVGVTPLEHAKRRGFAQMARLLEARAAR